MRNMQLAMNRDLIFLVHPASTQVPTLTDQAVLNFDTLFHLNQEQAGLLQGRRRTSLFEEDNDLVAAEDSMKSSTTPRSLGETSDGGGSPGVSRHQQRSSLARFTTVRDSVRQTARGLALQVRQIGGSKHLERQRCWAQQEWPEGVERVRHKLKLQRHVTIEPALGVSADTTDGAVQQLKEEIGLHRFTAPGSPNQSDLPVRSDTNGNDLDSVLWAHLQQEAVQQQHHLEAMENLMRSESLRRQKQIAIMEQLVRSASRATNIGWRSTPRESVSTAGFERF